MKVVSLDLHAEASQVCVMDENGKVVMEMPVPTEARRLRDVVSAVSGPKCVVFEEGPLSSLVTRALEDVADRVVSCDPAHNALIARDESSNDERDARHLAKLYRLEAVREVYVPGEPYLSLRSLLVHRLNTVRLGTRVKNRIKALARGCGIRTQGRYLYRKKTRARALEGIDSPQMCWQMQSLWRLLDEIEGEVAGAMKKIREMTSHFPAAENLQTVPGIGPVVCADLLAWIAEPERFDSRGAVNSYAGLGLGQGVTSWQPVGPARASRRGNRHLKRALFLAANSAANTPTALGDRYRIRLRQGWDRKKALRDLARKILHISMVIMTKGATYDDSKVNGPNLGSHR